MYLREDLTKVQSGYTLRHYCSDCGSTNIRMVCDKCGSHNIKYPAIFGDNEKECPGYLPNYVEKKNKVYKCDKCEKEFVRNYLKDNTISFDDGEFRVGDYREDDSGKWIFQKDYCDDCLQKLATELNKQIDNLCNFDYMVELLNKL